MHKLFLAASLLTLTISAAWAENCNYINNMKWPVTIDNVRNQGDIGWCYAYAAADLLGSKTGENLSPRDLANSYNNTIDNKIDQYFSHTKEYELEGGQIKTAMRKGLRKGICENAFLPDAKDGRTKGRMKALYDVRAQVWKKFPQGARPNVVAEFLAEQKLITDKLAEFLPELSISDFAKVLITEKEKNFYDKLIDINCYGGRVKPNERISFRNHTKFTSLQDEAFMKKLDQYLNKGKIVGISYFASILDAPNGKLEGRHASSIVARRLNPKTNQCEYLIRNSWGPGCHGYASVNTCEKGHIWVPSDLVKKGLNGITIIRD